MTKPIPPRIGPTSPGTIYEMLGNCIIESQKWITDADQGAVCLSLKLARCIDTIFDTGEDLDKVAALIGRLTILMKELKLTPLSRDQSKASAEEIDHGTKYADSYLRLVKPSNNKPKTQGSKPRANSRKSSQ